MAGILGSPAYCRHWFYLPLDISGRERRPCA